MCRSQSTFFGLTPNEAAEYRAGLFSQIHEIVFHGKGGYDFGTVYNMPIWLRRLTFKRIAEFYEDQNKQNKAPSSSNEIARGPNISPSYSTKASK